MVSIVDDVRVVERLQQATLLLKTVPRRRLQVGDQFDRHEVPIRGLACIGYPHPTSPKDPLESAASQSGPCKVEQAAPSAGTRSQQSSESFERVLHATDAGFQLLEEVLRIWLHG
jgi:hypothetical protein